MFKLNFLLGKYYYGISIVRKPYLKERMYGITNRCRDGQYIVTLDYDLTELEWIIAELKVLMKVHNLGTVYIFESSKGNYWAVSLAKKSFKEFVEIMQSTSCDNAYKWVPLNYGKKLWTIRLSPKNKRKPKLVYMLRYVDVTRKIQISKAHYMLLRKFYPKIRLGPHEEKNLDEEKEMIISSYGDEKNAKKNC